MIKAYRVLCAAAAAAASIEIRHSNIPGGYYFQRNMEVLANKYKSIIPGNPYDLDLFVRTEVTLMSPRIKFALLSNYLEGKG